MCALHSTSAWRWSTKRKVIPLLNLPERRGLNPTLLASQIELCDVLLVEISGVRSSLCKDLNHTRGAPQPGGQMGWNV